MESGENPRYDAYHSRASVLLTGGESRRMGEDKASLPVGGKPLALHLADVLNAGGWPPCVLGRQPVGDYPFIADDEAFRGPVHALAGYVPTAEFVFVLSCDVPCFRVAVADAFLAAIEGFDAVMPSLDGRWQPLCALYRAPAWEAFGPEPPRRVFDWVDGLSVRTLGEAALLERGIRPAWVTGANTPEAFRALLTEDGMAPG